MLPDKTRSKIYMFTPNAADEIEEGNNIFVHKISIKI